MRSPTLLLAVVLAGIVCVLEGRLIATRPRALLGSAPTTAETLPADPRLEPDFAAHMTTDDVARGVYALAAETGPVALTPEQRTQIRPLLVEGAALRAHLGDLREARRAARARWVEPWGSR